MKFPEAYLSSVSGPARQFLESLPAFEDRPPMPANLDAETWRAYQTMIEDRMAPVCEQTRNAHSVEISVTSAGPLNALLITPSSAPHDKAPVIYVHGGAYTGFSAHSSLAATIPFAVSLKRPLIAIDYPLAPHVQCPETVALSAAAIKAILQCHPQAGLIGESAGGGLALAAINHLMATGPHPGFLVLVSPWTDLAPRGESRETLAAHDPILRYDPALRISAEAYAGDELNRPDASPIFADYSANYPRSLILCGSREILLSDSLRLFEKLTTAGAQTMLSVREGMFHSYPVIAPTLPESAEARTRIKSFIDA